MTPKILELIKKDAEDKFPLRNTENGLKDDILNGFIEDKRRHYQQGQIDAIERMIGFVEWLRENADAALYNNGEKVWWLDRDQKSYTTTELLEKYLNK